MTDVRITFKYPTFPENTIPKGHLLRERACQAAWWYYILAEKQRTLVGRGPESQVIVEDIHDPQATPWHDTHYVQTGRSIALMYEISFEQMLMYWDIVTRECRRMGLPIPHPDYTNPKRFMM